MLLTPNEASQSGQTMQQAQEETLNLIYTILKRLLERTDQEKGSSKHSDQSEQSSAVDPQQENNLCAHSVQDLLWTRGTQEMTDDGIQHVYRAENYTLSANLTDRTGFPVYTVTCPERGDIFKFQNDPTRPEEYVFFETQHTLKDAERANLLTSLKNSIEGAMQKSAQSQAVVADALNQEPAVSATPAMKAFDEKIDRDALLGRQAAEGAAAKVKTELDELRDFAPLGSKAALVAHQVLGDLDEREGERYSVRRTESSSIELFEGRLPDPTTGGASSLPLLSLSPEGKVSCSEGFTQSHAKSFSKMHGALVTSKSQPSRQAATSRSVSNSKSKVTAAVEIGGR